MRSREDAIRDHATREAIKNGLMSGQGKLGIIARVLGDRVVARHGENHGVSPVFENLYHFDQDFMDDPFEEDSDELPTLEDGEKHTASLFNGYSRGLHLEIKYDCPELLARWQGEIVYHEMSGELLAYCPGEWETPINKLCQEARKKELTFIDLADQRNEIIGRRKKEEFLDEMKRKWGLKSANARKDNRHRRQQR